MSTGSMMGRMKNAAGENDLPSSFLMTAAGSIQLHDHRVTLELDAASDLTLAETFLLSPTINQGRRVTIINLSATGNLITLPANTLAAAKEGQLVAGGNIILSFGQAVTLEQRVNGTWSRTH